MTPLGLPPKVIDILQDPSICKTGVQVRGDGQKLLRDFPKGIRSLLELSYIARKVDPINTGPGAMLIALARLGRAYLGAEIDKDKNVRMGNWAKRLDALQIKCTLLVRFYGPG